MKAESHKRINNMLLGSLQRPILQWFCTRMPSWINPDILTAGGILGCLLIFFGYWLTNYNRNFLWLVNFGFFVNWFGDSLDGTLARFRKTERPKYGFFVDHAVDSFNTALIFVGAGLSPYVDMVFAVLAYIGYLLISIITYLNTIVGGEFVISYAKIGPTEMRIVAIIFNTAVFFFGNPQLSLLGKVLSAPNLFMIALGIFLFTGFITITITEIARWNKLDPPKRSVA
jgi:archaetidylinositol phosphate synthase